MMWDYKALSGSQPMGLEQLRELGKEGWELCGIAQGLAQGFDPQKMQPVVQQRIIFYFKKPIQESSSQESPSSSDTNSQDGSLPH